VVERSAVNRLVVGSNPTSGAIRRAFGLLMASGRAANGPELAEGPSDRLHVFILAGALFFTDRAGLFKPPVMLLIETARRMVPTLCRGTPIVYILRLRSGALYVGCSTDFEVRFREHEQGVACRTTSIDPPDALILLEVQIDFRAARQRESQIKRWSRKKKLALARQNYALLSKLSQSRD
jgi:putative endonuclease